MLRTDVNIFDTFCLENSLTYLGEEEVKPDKSVNGTPISDEVIESSKLKGVIGKIGGIGADSNEPTRNGRRYPLELWQNVEKSEYFIEGMKNRTLIGEADHPQERLDYSVTEGAVVLTKYEIQDDGKVYTEFDILDTIPGRTVKTYFDAGCKLGVSSRGLGEEVMVSGEKIIDPETYQFYCFDVVAFPAVKSARMDLIESTSPKKQNLINSITSEIKKCKSIDEVKFVESLSKGVNLYLDEIKEAVEIKYKELTESTDDDKTKELAKSIIDKIDNKENKTTQDSQLSDFLKAWLGESKENISSLLTQLKEEIDKNSSENNKIEISEGMIDSDEDTPENNDESDLQILAEIQEDVTNDDKFIELQKELKLKTDIIKNLLAKNYTQSSDLEKQSDEIRNFANMQTECESLRKNVFRVKSENKKLKDTVSVITKKYENLQKANREFSIIIENLNKKVLQEQKKNYSLRTNESSLKIKNNKLEESLNQHKVNHDKLNVLSESVSKLKSENSELKIQNEAFKNETKKLTEKIKKLDNEKSSLSKNYTESIDKYISMVCTKYNLKESTLRRLLGENYSIKDVDKIAKELVENNSKLNALPFAHMIPDRQIIAENMLLDDKDESDNENIEKFHFMLESKNN